MDESSWNVRGSRGRGRTRSRDNDDSSRSQEGSEVSGADDPTRRKRSGSGRSLRKSDKHSDDGYSMDASTSSAASWNVKNVNLAGANGPEARAKAAASFQAAGISVPGYNSMSWSGRHQDLEPRDPMWFEKYMPNWVVVIRAFCGSIVLNDAFQLIMVLLISANALCMGLATFDFIDEDDQLRSLFERLDSIFLYIFTVELSLQFGYWGYQVFTDGWLLFDVVTIVSGWLLDGVQVFRSFRIFRAFRLVVRIPILKSLVYAVFHVIPRISSIMGLFALLTYIYAVMATTLYKDYYDLGLVEGDYFGRLDYSLFTLFQFVTLEGWADIVRMYAAHDYFANIIFGSFLTISGFILYSLVVAVVCDSFLMVESKIRAELAAKAKEERERRKRLKRRKSKRNLKADDGSIFDSSRSLGFDESDMELEDLDKRLTSERDRLRSSANPGQQRAMKDDGKKKKYAGTFVSRSENLPPDLSVSSYESFLPSHPSAARGKRGVPPPLPNTRYDESTDFDFGDLTDEEREHALTEAMSPTVATTTKSLAFGELERKKRGSRKKYKPVKQRIKRVKKRLDKLTAAQSEILTALNDMCKEMETRNGIADE